MQQKTSVQHKLDRVRMPRVHITYDVFSAGAIIEAVELPFVIGVLSDLSGIRDTLFPRLIERQFIEIDLDNFDVVMAAIQPRLAFTVENVLPGGDRQLAVHLRFRCLDDFEPAQVINQVQPLLHVLAMRQQLADGPAQGHDQPIEIFNLDTLLSRQVSRILHAPEFQKLEATWRGLYFLVSRTETSPLLKIRVLNVSKEELLEDFEDAVEFDQSALFKKVYEDVYGTFRGDPFGALIGDYAFDRHLWDISLLENIASVAAAAHAPFIAAASPDMFGYDSFTKLNAPRDLAKIFARVEYFKWNAFRASEHSCYIGLTVPRILLRAPYVPRPTPGVAFQFTEEVNESHHCFLWGNAAYAFGACLTNAFAKYAWCAAIRGLEGGGLVEGLPTYTFRTDEGDIARKCPTEIAIADRREKELSDLGFIPLTHCKGTDYAAFFGAQSCQKPKTYDTDAATANARLATQLECLMTTSRFAHYLRAIARDRLGSFQTRGDCERFLNQWLLSYVLMGNDPSPRTKAQRPLREARVDVSEVPGKPGVYQAHLFLRPHFQLDELTVSLRLVVELPRPWH